MKQTATARVWSNWTGDQVCRPSELVRPRSNDEVAAALTKASERGLNVRVAGAGHSFNDAVLSDGMILCLDRMNQLLDVDTRSRRVRVQAGAALSHLNARLQERGLALENLGDIDVQSLAGATATGTHGTGATYRNISASIESIELMKPDGSTVELNDDSDTDGLLAARIGLGALGVVTAMTLRTVPSFTLHAVDRAQPLDEVLESLDALIAENDHFEFYTFPHSTKVWTRVNNRTEDEPRPRSRPSAWFHDMFLVNTMFGLTCRTGRRFRRTIPTLNRISAALAGGGERIDHSYRIFASPRLVRFTETEYAIPQRDVIEVVRALHRTIEKNGYDVPIPMEVRFGAPDDALLSPASGRATAYVSVHMFEKMEWEGLFRSVRAIMNEVDGRPHWGKRHFETAETLRPLYPGWDRFAAVRARLDPTGVFANDHLRRVLGE